MPSLVVFGLMQMLITLSNAQWYDTPVNDSCKVNNTDGRCMNIRQCPAMMALFNVRPVSLETVAFLQSIQCGFEGSDPKLCCPTINAPSQETHQKVIVMDDPTTKPSVFQTKNSRSPLLPNECGRSYAMRVIGGQIADLAEFPWMVALEYQRSGNAYSSLCSGVLISKRYVLTAAHCIGRTDLLNPSIVKVRLGDYNIATNPDCFTSEVCAPPAVTVDVEETVVHEGYSSVNRQVYDPDDIALLRMARDVVFTEFIKPICLPSRAEIAQNITWLIGWGRTENRSGSDILLKVRLPHLSLEACNGIFHRRGMSITISPKQVCAGGEKGRDACKGDSGGPLMSIERNSDGYMRYVLVGAVSFGATECGVANWPGVFTNIFAYTDWILSKIRA